MNDRQGSDNFYSFFPNETIATIQALSPGYDDHASEVWYVKTDAREMVIRTSGIKDLNESIFFDACHTLFGIDPRNVFALEAINRSLAGMHAFRVPRVLEKHHADRPYVVTEWLPGSTLMSFESLTEEALRQFGAGLAAIHRKKLDYWGNPAGTFRVKLDDIHAHMIHAMQVIREKHYAANQKMAKYGPLMEKILQQLPAPTHTSYVMVDMDPTQFLSDKGIITGLVDTEAYVAAMPALDFIALEYVCSRKTAGFIAQGYETLSALPALREVRTVYRYLYRLVEVQGREDIDEWLNKPILFDT